ncbi:MAG: hypothetical protein RI907_2772 [Pseudomonadota bacterium]
MPDDRVRQAPLKGRGTATQRAHRFEAWAREREADGWEAEAAAVEGEGLGAGSCEPPRPVTQLTWHPARSILSRNDSPDIPFEQAVNPYRGCEHGCIYCYARPTHSYLNLSPGLDFETRILGKANAAELLRKELSRPGHVPSPINLGSATDVYQPVEREARLTRSLIEVLDACRHPFTLVTKSALVTRDIDLLARAARRRQVYVMVSVTTLDNALSRVLEPRASSALRRLQAVRALAEAGVPVGVNVAPIIPFINEPEIEAIVAAAAAAGAQTVHHTVLRLPWEVRPLFEEWLHHHHPLKAARVMARLQDLGDGQVYSADFGARMKGRGIWAQLISQRMARAAQRHGLSLQAPTLSTDGFAVPDDWRARRVSPPVSQAPGGEAKQPGQQSLF